MEAIHQCLLLHGHYGYTKDLPFEQRLRDVIGLEIGDGTAYLARIVGQKKAREIWFLCERYSAQEAYEMGLVNKVVPHAELMTEVDGWCQKILDKSPTALKMLKHSLNADTSSIEGITQLGMAGLAMYYNTEEAQEGNRAFREKRPVDFRQFRR